MLLGILAVGGCLVAGVFTLIRRKNHGGEYGQAGAQAVKLGRLY